MSTEKLKAYLIFPYLRVLENVVIGEFTFKGYDEIKSEPADVQQELRRIQTFFMQKDARRIDAFAYYVLEGTKEDLSRTLTQLKRSLEIFRYLTLEPDGKGLSTEHTTLFVIYPEPKNPWKHKDEEHYMYRVIESFHGEERYATFPRSGGSPPFYKDVQASSPPYFDEELADRLFTQLSDGDMRAITWYNKTYSTASVDGIENLLRLSIAFESHFSLSEKDGKERTIRELVKEIESNISKENLPKVIKQISPFITSRIVRGLAEEVVSITGSDTITKWFKTHLYSIGSNIRHGDEIRNIPIPVDSKSKLGKSIWYAGNATHEYLNNVSFGKKLFRFILNERYNPSSRFVKQSNITHLEQLLVSDEERLKILEHTLLSKPIGELSADDIRIAFSFNSTYYGDKKRVFTILKRILEELKTIEEVWKQIEVHGEIILQANLKEGDFDDYEKFNPYAHALIETDSHFNKVNENGNNYSEENMKLFYIREFLGFALYKLI